jgi:hypothetical protein
MEEKTDIKLVIIIILIVLVGVAYFYSPSRNEVIKDKPGTSNLLGSYAREESSIPVILPITQSATCTFNRLSGASFEFREKEDTVGRASTGEEKAKIYYDSWVESQPNIVSFIDLDTKEPKMTANMGQDSLIKAYEDEEVIQMVEGNTLSTGTMITYTIFKKDGVAIWSKQYNFLGVPVGYMGMGYCK